MKKMWKRMLSMLLVVLLLGGAAPLGALTLRASAKTIGDYAQGDLVEFGWYPQSEVTDADLIAALNASGGAWQSYGYYSGTGNAFDGQMTAKDYMKYCDVTVSGQKYRGVTFSQYRPHSTGDYTSSIGYTLQENGYNQLNYAYWFRYDPLQWRVLDPAAGLVLCETIVDSQPYNNYILSSGYYDEYDYVVYWGDAGKTHYANNYAESSLRQWLNDDFYNTAFSPAQQAILTNTTLDNRAYSTSCSAYDSVPTTDKVFLLSWNDALNTAYGFNADNLTHDLSRRAQGSDYAMCQRVYAYSSNKCSGWWLRSPGFSSSSACVVACDGGVYNNSSVDYTCCGIRPALKLNLSSAIFQSDVGEVGSGSGTSDVCSASFTYWSSEDHSASVDVTFDLQWILKENTVYNHSLAQFCVKYSMLGYTASANGKTEEEIVQAGLEAMHFQVDPAFVNLHTDRDEENYFIAHRTFWVNGEQQTLVFAGLIGSHKKQWYSDFDPYGTEREKAYAIPKEKDKVHLGFADARNYVFFRLEEYYNKNDIDQNTVKLLLTGHSRGAAAANMLAAKLLDTGYLAKPENIYAYTFATPRGVKKEYVGDKKYSCIFNIVNPEDFVTKVMLDGWGYSRYGETLTLPSQTNDTFAQTYISRMRMSYERYTGGYYMPYAGGEEQTYNITQELYRNVPTVEDFYSKKFQLAGPVSITPFEFFKQTLLCFVSGEPVPSQGIALAKAVLTIGQRDQSAAFLKDVLLFFMENLDLNALTGQDGIEAVKDNLAFSQAHRVETYCAYMQVDSYTAMKERESHKNTVNCPVDVEVYVCGTDELVGRIVDNVVDEAIAAKENAIVMRVDGDSKQFWLPGNGDYTVKLTGNDTGTMDYTVAEIDADEDETKRVNFFDVPVENGVSLTGDFRSSQDVEEYALRREDESVLLPTETFADQTQTVLIETTAEAGGNVGEAITAVRGDYLCVMAVPEDEYQFDGWYENGVRVSQDAVYGFVAKADRTLVAKFDACRYTVKWVADGSETTESYAWGTAIHTPDDPIKEGFTFIGWSPEVPAVMPTHDLTFTAQFRENETPPAGKVHSVTANGLTMLYKNSATIQPVVTADSGVRYTVAYSGFDSRIISVDANGKVTALKKGSTNVTVTATDEYGNTEECALTVTVKYAWWQWFIIIFLFGWIWY